MLSIQKAFSIKTTQSVPRSTSQIIIIGAPQSGRTTLGKKIAEFYNLIYISTSFLIAEEIRKDTIHGRKIKSQYLNSEMIDSFLLEKLIEDRVSKKDCKLQGFVLEGYPKNKDQFENIKNLKLNPTLIVAIDASK